MAECLRVAVIGASGVGQHHARWYHLSGCDVVAIGGTSELSCRRAAGRLGADFGFRGDVFWDLEDMFGSGSYDIVDVSTPYSHHRRPVEMALAAGSHVVCEKPLVWDGAKAPGEILGDGRAMVEAARKANRILAMSAQYPASIPSYCDLYREVRGEAVGRIESVSMEMEVKIRGGNARPYESMWIDRASHPLSLLLAFVPDAEIDSTTVTCTLSERENVARFDADSEQGRVEVTILMREIEAGDPVRRFGVNGFLADWRGFPDEAGIYRAGLSHEGREVAGDDFLHAFIRQMADAVRGEAKGPVVTGAAGLRNLEMQADLLGRATRV